MTDPEPPKRGWTTPILSGIAALLLAVFLVVPGYIAGYYCRVAHDNDSEIIFLLFEHADFGMVNNRALRIFLTPARLATKIAPPLVMFYSNQFDTASGIRTSTK